MTVSTVPSGYDDLFLTAAVLGGSDLHNQTSAKGHEAAIHAALARTRKALGLLTG
ncbi:hypothetical protein K2X14_02155 [Acetobacter sp. TBRC 12305]|uniref:Uncharacterized protein n=1 Tax=Acetobacter garciniae TaxID=2817435 RepID=A0A939HN21_9PROT|nr:hypothetical protein [Acetobacter garciniae]MBO1323956.1 hypothetical protein [Acetobacter garciniae]MBX0343645.1 hypothetical protein [Acetobacter garciniae]